MNLKLNIKDPLVEYESSSSNSLEDQQGTSIELEYEIYGHMRNISDIVKLNPKVEHQEQYEILLENGSMRIRATTKEGQETEYVMTLKTWTPGVAGRVESNSGAIDESFFDNWKRLAKTGLKKTRYSVPAGKQRLTVPSLIEQYGELVDLTWEIDVFETKNHMQSDWVKLDLEVKQPLKQMPPLPIELTDKIVNGSNSRTDAEKAKIRQYYDKEFNVKG